MYPSKIPVFFRPEMVADSLSFSPSAAKPVKVVDAWLAEGFDIEILSPTPATKQQLYRAHSKGFVDDILAGKRNNGFGNKSVAVAQSLPYTSGSMLAAVREALLNGIGAVSPTSGFHHAGHDFCGGFCTFNGLMVAVREFRDLKIGILDLDYHYGNGTADIIGVFDCNVIHYSQGQHGRRHPRAWLEALPRRVRKLFAGCDAVIYQAGQDPHVDDPLGGWLTTEQLFERDRIVFETLRSMGVPVAWNLAGGYTDPFSTVINGHVNTMRAFSDVFFKG